MNNQTRKYAIAVIALIVLGAGLFALVHLRKPESDLRDVVVRPVPVQIDVNNLNDGIYPVAFEQKEIAKADGGYNVPFEIFNMDLYDAVELHQMEVGGYIEIAGNLVKIDSLSKEGTVKINGGLDYGGAELVPMGGGVYRNQGWDDIATYTSCGKVTLFVPDTIDFVDRGNVEESMQGVVVPGKDAFEYLTTVQFGSFNQYCTKIRIEEGAVVEFWRVYMP